MSAQKILVFIEIPITYFNISPDYNNNCFHFELTFGEDVKIYKVELIPGQYRARKQGAIVDANSPFNFRKGWYVNLFIKIIYSTIK